MLDVANSLEARYRTLLDTAPSRAPDLPTPTPPPASTPTTSLSHTPSHLPAPAVRSPPPTSPTISRLSRARSLPPHADIIELDSEGEERAHEVIKVEPTSAQPILARHDTTESLKLRIKFPSRPPPSASPLTPQAPPSPSSREQQPHQAPRAAPRGEDPRRQHARGPSRSSRMRQRRARMRAFPSRSASRCRTRQPATRRPLSRRPPPRTTRPRRRPRIRIQRHTNRDCAVAQPGARAGGATTQAWWLGWRTTTPLPIHKNNANTICTHAAQTAAHCACRRGRGRIAWIRY
ncbi:hypothetical protein BC826DRAFT_716324 [Russula brevipes]|nr:hypothetical protein BC826DRAFT_716324 [Russula brevipes]